MENPNYYAILTAEIRYDKTLNPIEKLLFAELTALTNKYWFCFATNDYLANIFDRNKLTISRIIARLWEKWYIKIDIEDKTKRKISILSTIDENVKGGLTKTSRGIDENVNHNNIINNNNNNKGENEKILNDEDFYIYSVEELRKYLNKGQLMEKYYWKIWNEDSFERMTTDFFLYCEDKWKLPKKSTATHRFVSYLTPKWEKREDVENMKKNATRIIKLENNINEEQKMIEKAKRDIETARNIENLLSDEIKQEILLEANNIIINLTKWKGSNMPWFQKMIQSKYYSIILSRHWNLINSAFSTK